MIPNVITLKYSRHAKQEWSDERGFIKNPPKKFFKQYNKFEDNGNGTLKCTYPFVHDKKYNLILIIDIESGVVITNYLTLR
jgi:hypothetical protein